MPKKKVSKKQDNKNDLDVNIRIEALENLIKQGRKKRREKIKCKGCGSGFWVFGSALAMILSYTQNSSILWAIIHGILSWFYILYRVLLPYF